MGHGEQPVSSDDTPSRRSAEAGSYQSSRASSYEKHEPRKRYGWPHLADKMAKVPEYAAFPRFRQLNVKNLLYYQVQLKSLEKKILKQEEEESLNLERYDHLVEEIDEEYHKLLIELRILLREYSKCRLSLRIISLDSLEHLMTSLIDKAVLQYSQVSALSDPEAYNMSSLRRWLFREDGANGTVRSENGADETWGNMKDGDVSDNLWKHFRTVLEALIWAKAPPKVDLDLVVTHPETKIDGLTRWAVYYLAPFYWTLREKRQRTRKEQKATSEVANKTPDSMSDEEAQKKKPSDETDPEDQNTVKSMSELTALRLTSSLSTIIACLIPVVAIAVLTQVSGTRDLLLCITGFAVVFAVGLIFLTQGTSSRTEIFAATAA
jgi:hypothetical protein